MITYCVQISSEMVEVFVAFSGLKALKKWGSWLHTTAQLFENLLFQRWLAAPVFSPISIKFGWHDTVFRCTTDVKKLFTSNFSRLLYEASSITWMGDSRHSSGTAPLPLLTNKYHFLPLFDKLFRKILTLIVLWLGSEWMSNLFFFFCWHWQQIFKNVLVAEWPKSAGLSSSKLCDCHKRSSFRSLSVALWQCPLAGFQQRG